MAKNLTRKRKAQFVFFHYGGHLPESELNNLIDLGLLELREVKVRVATNYGLNPVEETRIQIRATEKGIAIIQEHRNQG